MHRAIRASLLSIAFAAVAGGCGSPGTSGTTDGTVVVLAAASLTDVFGEIETAFEAAHPGIDVELNFAGSSALREQILQGVPADVFASANEPTMEAVVAAGESSGMPAIFATNSLSIAVPAGVDSPVSGLAEFADSSLLIGLCSAGVPCGDAARQVFANAGIEPAIDTNEPDVRALLTKIGVDELDAGIVYTTDIAANDRVVEIAIDPSVNVEARYPIVALAGAPHPDAAADFVDFVLSAPGQDILSLAGFGRP